MLMFYIFLTEIIYIHFVFFRLYFIISNMLIFQDLNMQNLQNSVLQIVKGYLFSI